MKSTGASSKSASGRRRAGFRSSPAPDRTIRRRRSNCAATRKARVRHPGRFAGGKGPQPIRELKPVAADAWSGFSHRIRDNALPFRRSPRRNRQDRRPADFARSDRFMFNRPLTAGRNRVICATVAHHRTYAGRPRGRFLLNCARPSVWSRHEEDAQCASFSRIGDGTENAVRRQ